MEGIGKLVQWATRRWHIEFRPTLDKLETMGIPWATSTGMLNRVATLLSEARTEDT